MVGHHQSAFVLLPGLVSVIDGLVTQGKAHQADCSLLTNTTRFLLVFLVIKNSGASVHKIINYYRLFPGST
jgi:hypothetical protein